MNEPFVEELNFSSHSDCTSKESGHILKSLSFLRLSNWEECRKAPSMTGDVSCGEQIFRRFRLKQNREVSLDLWHRGFDVTDSVANEFFRLVSSPQKVSIDRLVTISDVLGPISGAVRTQTDDELSSMVPIRIKGAEVISLNSKNVLFVYWSDSKQMKTHISVYVDSNCDGLKVDELHFSSPVEISEECDKAIFETIESIQWNILVPPPIPGMFQPVIS